MIFKDDFTFKSPFYDLYVGAPAKGKTILSSGDTITSCLSGPPEAGDMSTMFKAQIVILFVFNMSFKMFLHLYLPFMVFYAGTPAKG